MKRNRTKKSTKFNNKNIQFPFYSFKWLKPGKRELMD